ncbi:hypothetical protein E5F05_01920 (plasmid) [Deinococcus metallilatus]|nr:hypothetical protein E5F05_01920 [Deinococcus metallilatus]
MDFDLRALLTLDGLHLDQIVLDEQSGLIVVEVHSTTPTPHCPQCGTPAGRTRSTYTRTLADLPWGGRRVVWRLRVRRCPCLCPSCPQRIFAERFKTLTVPFARRTSRLAESLRAIGLALGGRGENGSLSGAHWWSGARRCSPSFDGCRHRRWRLSGCWAWTTGRTARGRRTERSWWITRPGELLTSCPTGSRTRWPPGCTPTRACRS